MNLSLKTTCIHWINVFLRGFQTAFGSFFCSNLCSDENPYGFIGLQWLIHVVNHEIFYGFGNFLGFQNFLNQTRLNSYGSTLIWICWCSWVWRGKFRFSPVFYSEVWIRIFRTLWTWFCFADSGLKSENKSVILLLLHRFKTLEILSLFLLSFFLWSYWICCFQRWIQCLNCRSTGSMMKIHHWISETCYGFHGFGLNLLLEIARVCEIVLQFSEFFVIFDLTEWREKNVNLLVMWHCICGSFSDWYSVWPYIGCHVDSEPMKLWHLALYCLRGTLDQTVKKDLRTKL